MSEGNTIIAKFSGGVEVRFTAEGTGVLQSGYGNIDIKVQRLGWNDNGLAFYEADPLTGGINKGGTQLLPGDPGYLSNALNIAREAGTYLSASQLPSNEGSSYYKDLPLTSGKNYGLLILHSDNPNALSSCYSQANNNTAVQMKSFYTQGRGITYGIEDVLLSNNSDRDYNDLIVTLFADRPSII